MGCVSSTFLEDDDRRIIGVSASASHIVSLTSSTYGILTTLHESDHQIKAPLPPPPPPPPPPPLPLLPATKPPLEAEVINSWELMAGLLDPSTPAKSPLRSSCKDNRPPHPRRCIRFPLRPIDANRHLVTPPGGAHSAVLYTTTLRGVRATFEACNAVRAALQSHGVAFRERDISMDRGFREELRDLTRGLSPSASAAAAVPRLFVRGRHVGGAEEVARLDEEGALAPLLEGLPRARGGLCDGCGGMRFLPCFECCGSRKVVVGGVVLRCGECNENGLVLCPICS